VFLLAGTATAQITGPCTAIIAGVDADSAATPQTAVEVDKDQSIAIEVTGPEKFTGHKVMLEFAGVQWTVNEQSDDGKSWSDSVDVAKYAKYGVGLYKVIGVSTGNPCTGTAYVNVKGSPLGTAAGAAAAAMTIVGGVLVAVSAVRAAGRPAKEMTELQLQQQEAKTLEMEEELMRSGGRTTKIGPFYCLVAAPWALAQTLALMVSGAGAPGAPAVGRRVGFTPAISISGVAGAILAGLGTLVLAQQFGIVYPTRTVTLIWMVAAIVIEVLLTTVMQRSGAKKALSMPAPAAAEQSPAQPEAEA
jgi:hypothetical protein